MNRQETQYFDGPFGSRHELATIGFTAYDPLGAHRAAASDAVPRLRYDADRRILRHFQACMTTDSWVFRLVRLLRCSSSWGTGQLLLLAASEKRLRASKECSWRFQVRACQSRPPRDSRG